MRKLIYESDTIRIKKYFHVVYGMTEESWRYKKKQPKRLVCSEYKDPKQKSKSHFK